MCYTCVCVCESVIANCIPVMNLPLMIFGGGFFGFCLADSVSSLSPRCMPEEETCNKSNYNPQKQKKRKKYSIANALIPETENKSNCYKK